MKFPIPRLVVSISFVALVAFAACDNAKKEQAGENGGESATAGHVMPSGDIPYADMLAKAGFKAIYFNRFPAQVPGRKAAYVVYRADRKKGGILYLQGKTTEDLGICWHWYFTDGAPDSMQAVELNGDGLWDVVVYMDNGEKREMVQDKDFTFFTGDRVDHIALNGSASASDDLWKCFDGDSSTAWSSGSDEGYVEVPTPLGVDDGILVLRLPPDTKNPSGEVYADGKKVQDIKLEQTDLEQRVQLDPAVKKAGKVKVVIKGEDAGISELAIQ